MRLLRDYGSGLVYHADAFELLALLPDHEVDLYLGDLPYGTTCNEWDLVIDFSRFWREVRRVMKPRGAIILTAAAPFDKLLVCSNLDDFRYEWVVEKDLATGHLNAKKQPMRAHETVCVFGVESPVYHPQKIVDPGLPKAHSRYGSTAPPPAVFSTNYGVEVRPRDTDNEGVRNPRTVLRGLWPNVKGRIAHPTQKPNELWEYLIETYSLPGETVVDATAGSGTTAVAARNLRREYIVGDSSEFWADEIVRRLESPDDRTWAAEARERLKDVKTTQEAA